MQDSCRLSNLALECRELHVCSQVHTEERRGTVISLVKRENRQCCNKRQWKWRERRGNYTVKGRQKRGVPVAATGMWLWPKLNNVPTLPISWPCLQASAWINTSGIREMWPENFMGLTGGVTHTQWAWLLWTAQSCVGRRTLGEDEQGKWDFAATWANSASNYDGQISACLLAAYCPVLIAGFRFGVVASLIHSCFGSGVIYTHAMMIPTLQKVGQSSFYSHSLLFQQDVPIARVEVGTTHRCPKD